MLQWSPPYLWPGQAIQYYNVFVTNEKKESAYYRVTTTFRDEVVFLEVTTTDEYISPMCSELQFFISAIGYDDTKLSPFSAVGGYLPSEYIV